MANEIIHKLDVAQESRQLSAEEFQLRKDLKNRVLGLAALERSRRRQQSRMIWLKEGGACTRFFHLRASGRRRKNFIACLKKENAEYAWSHDDKAQLLEQHFLKIVGTNEHHQDMMNWTYPV
jgi:hypothetical protein